MLLPGNTVFRIDAGRRPGLRGHVFRDSCVAEPQVFPGGAGRSRARVAMKQTLLSWSSGKDSAWSLYVLQQQNDHEVVGLLTTFNQVADRVAMHGVRRTLVEEQAAAAGIPVWAVPLPWPCSNVEYESIMATTCAKAISEGIEAVAFGDLFLQDVRAYRERQMKGTG